MWQSAKMTEQKCRLHPLVIIFTAVLEKSYAVVNKGNIDIAATLYPAIYAWLGLVVVYMGFLSVGFVFHFLPPILPVVIADLNISHGQAGLLMSLFALPGILFSLPGGWLVDRYGERLIGCLGVTLMGVGTLLLGLASDFSTILLARGLSGVGAMVGVVALQRLVIRLFTGRGLGLPVGISGSAVPVGIVIVLNAAGPLAEAEGWRVVAQRVGGVTSVIGVVFGLIIWFLTRGQSLGRDQKQDDQPLSIRSLMFRPIWIAGVVWFCANGAMTAFMTFAPDHFQDLGFDVSARGLFTSIPMWTSAALGMVTGWLTDRHGGRALFMIAGMVMMSASLLLLPADVVSPSLIGLTLGLSLAAVVTPTIAMPGALLPPTHTGRGYGILATCANVGIFVVPPLAGLSHDLSGGYQWPFVIMGVVAAIGVVAATALRRGRFMPGLSRHVLTVAAILLLSGCGNQDRYDVVSRQPNVTGEVTMGEFIDQTMFLESTYWGMDAADAWSATDLVVSGNTGQVIRVQGDLYISLGFPEDRQIVGMVCQPDGGLLVGLDDGQIWQWSGGTWQEEPEKPGNHLRIFTDDHQGRPLVRVRYTGELKRYEMGEWEQVGDDSRGYITEIWRHPDQGTWLATETRNILELTETGAVWVDSLIFQSEYGVISLAGDGVDRLAATTGGGDLWLRDSGAWTYYEGDPNESLSGMHWHQGQLYASSSGGDQTVWRDDQWQVLQEEAIGERVSVVVESDQDPILIGRSGAGYIFDGNTVTRISQSIGGVQGMAEYQGQLVAYLADGGLFQAEDVSNGVWRYLDKTTANADSDGDNNLLMDDRGLLVAHTETGLSFWDGDDFTDLLVDEYIRMFQPAADGEIIIATDVAIGSLRGGQLTWRPAEESLDTCRGLQRSSPTTIDFLDSNGLYRLADAGGFSTQWIAVGWQPWRLVSLSPTRTLVLGRDVARQIMADEITDMTPLTTSGTATDPVTLADAIELPTGNVLAWAGNYSGFLLWENEKWWEISPAVGESVWYSADWGDGRFLRTENYGLCIFGEGYLGLIDLGAGSP